MRWYRGTREDVERTREQTGADVVWVLYGEDHYANVSGLEKRERCTTGTAELAASLANCCPVTGVRRA